MGLFDFGKRISEPVIRNVAKCGGFRCENYVEIRDDNAPRPEIFICSACEQRMNQGIVKTLHARTGRTTGGFNSIDGYQP